MSNRSLAMRMNSASFLARRATPFASHSHGRSATAHASPTQPRRATLVLAAFLILATAFAPAAAATATPKLSNPSKMVANPGDPASLPAVLITNADKLNGYIAVKDFTSHFASFNDPYPPAAPTDPMFIQQNQGASTTGGRGRISGSATTQSHAHEYSVFCTVSDPDSQYTELVKRLGCHTITLTHTQRSQPAEWTRVYSTVATFTSATTPIYLLWVPDMHDHSGTDLATALSSPPSTLAHAVIWSRNGVQGPLTDDLTAFSWYRSVEQAALASSLASRNKLTILRLSFALERFLDLAPDIEDESALRLPIGTQGELIPISLHDAIWASHTIFQSSGQPNNSPKFKQIMHLTTRTPMTGAALAAAASKAFGYPIRFEAISRQEARNLLMSLENVTPQLATVLLDVFECARRAGSGCHGVAPDDEVKALLPGREVKSVGWFFEKYRDMFAPGGGL
ncbi:hypothetical protein BCR44DRAFT_40621 [Catenaria anguillulae PL171]|uniref:Uncharacterized protein n=1 Tax=Catenaria anguillulae PL171 TaxID=765915 RepID=A0A1Y2HQJ0_9FUNG|nr:hypothetical protein BCR44DRAFT_40621 [Catenaria anguillulae PL171]